MTPTPKCDQCGKDLRTEVAELVAFARRIIDDRDNLRSAARLGLEALVRLERDDRQMVTSGPAPCIACNELEGSPHLDGCAYSAIAALKAALGDDK